MQILHTAIPQEGEVSKIIHNMKPDVESVDEDQSLSLFSSPSMPGREEDDEPMIVFGVEYHGSMSARLPKEIFVPFDSRSTIQTEDSTERSSLEDDVCEERGRITEARQKGRTSGKRTSQRTKTGGLRKKLWRMLRPCTHQLDEDSKTMKALP